MKVFFARLGFRIWVATGLYYLWSRFWRWALERQYRNTKLTAHTSLAELEAVLSRMKWISDPLKGAFDIISSPEKVEHIYRMGVLNNRQAEIGDCDEFAVYAAVAIKDMVARSKVRAHPVFLMTVCWQEKDGRLNGHNICVFHDTVRKKWGHIGNYYDGKSQVQFENLREIALSICDGGKLIAWCYGDPELKGSPTAYYS